ncbi:hypothetical protein ABNB59_14755 [Paenibacillus larvae]|nr:hypothetical protein [Paenibacillus larvae]QVV19450.1 hypothetical protein Bert_48 [Paenibacillus phage Bert]QVV19851.1 hypothetical protein Mock2_48 [Paenibacillus phage Mock2]AQR76528.1 hypothetical protein BXP28_03180 [Paenibacillus larvae subsp. larvae]AVF22625.1 hypothetical protein ERICI_02813 [Paenibacillus larvae subsp. larvae]ETK25703.1 hypothetical protein ERIC1_3c00260 [Paenibacillus larvae subsp. larvae DSM 25719]
MTLSETLFKETGKKTGVVYATGLLKGREVLRMVADCRAQETIRTTAQRILDDAKVAVVRISDESLERLGNYYVIFNVWLKHRIGFEQFVNEVQTGKWKARLDQGGVIYDRSRNL